MCMVVSEGYWLRLRLGDSISPIRIGVLVYSSEPSFSVKSPRSYTCRGILFPSQTAPFTQPKTFILSTVARLAEKDSIEILA